MWNKQTNKGMSLSTPLNISCNDTPHTPTLFLLKGHVQNFQSHQQRHFSSQSPNLFFHTGACSYTMLPFKLMHHLICKRARRIVTHCHTWANKIVWGCKDIRKQEKQLKLPKRCCVFERSLDAENFLHFGGKEIHKYDTKEPHEHKNKNLFSRWFLWLKLKKSTLPHTFGMSATIYGFKQKGFFMSFW